MNTYQTEKKKMKRHMLLLGILALVIFGYAGWCIMDMKKGDSHATREYVENHVEQRAAMVNMEVSNGQASLLSMAESVEHGGAQLELKDFMGRKRKLYNLKFIAFYDIQNGELSTVGTPPEDIDGDWLQKYSEDQGGWNPKKCLVRIENQNIIYTVSLYRNGKKTGILCSGNTTEFLQKTITIKSFKERGSSYVVNGENQILLAAESKEKKHLWEQVIAQKEQGKLADSIKEMQEKLKNNKGGSFRFTADNDRQYYLSYFPTGINDWVNVTIVPRDLFTGFSDTYVMRMLGSLTGIVVVFCALFFLMSQNYSANERRIKRLAFSDDVTGGNNRLEFRMKYQELCRQHIADQYVIVLMNVADFKLINKSFGTKCGDKMLRYFYTVIVSFLREKDGEFAARTETDHFFLCLKERDPEIIRERLNNIINKINFSHKSDLPKYKIEFWNGASFVDDNKTDVTVVQDRAREALKNQKKDKEELCIFYDSVVAKRIQREKEMERMFISSVAAGDFLVYMQPKVSLSEGVIVGAEALVRWNCPGIGFIPPNEFIPVLENSGKIKILDRYVFEKVCIWMERRKQKNEIMFPVSVNLSRNNFMDEHFHEAYADIAAKHSIESSLIEFEVTETLFLDTSNIEKVKKGIRKIHEHGFRCAMDDFGVGYSSLTLLRTFDIDVLKMDRSFFLDLTDKKSRDVISCIVDLAEKLNIEIVSEGIETEDQIKQIQALGCDIVQGYFFSKPLPLKDFENWVNNFSKKSFDHTAPKIGGYDDDENTGFIKKR